MEYTKSFCQGVSDKNGSAAGMTSDIIRKLQSVISDRRTLFVGYDEDILDASDNGRLYCAIPKTFSEKVPWPKIRPFKTVAVDVNSLPFADETFEIVVANHCFEFGDRNIVFLNEIFRVLKQDGKAVTTVINGRNLNKKLFPGKIRSPGEIISDMNSVSFRISNIWGTNRKSRLLSYDFDYNQNKMSELLLFFFHLLSDVMVITADKTDEAPESIRFFDGILGEKYGTV
jgi:SAM-dependent methyltransferase